MAVVHSLRCITESEPQRAPPHGGRPACPHRLTKPALLRSASVGLLVSPRKVQNRLPAIAASQAFARRASRGSGRISGGQLAGSGPVAALLVLGRPSLRYSEFVSAFNMICEICYCKHRKSISVSMSMKCRSLYPSCNQSQRKSALPKLAQAFYRQTFGR